MSWWYELWISEAKVSMGNVSLISIMHHCILQEFSSCEMRINRHSMAIILRTKPVWSLTKEWIHIDSSKSVVLLYWHAVMVSGLIEIMVI